MTRSSDLSVDLGPQIRVQSGPHYVFRKSGGAVGAIATRIDDISGCGEPDLLLKVQRFLEKRFGKFKVQDASAVRVGMGLDRGNMSLRR